MNTAVLIIAGIVAVLFIGIGLLISNSTNKKKKTALKNLIHDRNASIDRGDDDAINKTVAAKTGKANISKKLKNAGDDIPTEGLNPKSIRYLLIQAGSNMPVYQFWMWSLACAAICFFASELWGFSQISVMLWTFTGFFGIPRFILKKKVTKRQNKFLEEFADCLEGMIRLLKSGMPITEAIAMTSREYTGPIGQEMTKVYEDQKVGDTLPEAVQKMTFRVPLAEVKMFSTAVTIQTQTGSSLSEVLQNLSGVIRQRFRLKRKVQALSAEAKISAGIIGCLPVVVMGSMYWLNREYIELLWITNTGKMLTYGALTWMSIGVFIMKGMINFRV
jgi:tight adherence protein B